MGLNQIDKIGRIVFLSMFSEEMFRHLIKKYESKKNVEFEKVKQKILEPFPEKIPVLKKDIPENVVKEIKPIKFEYSGNSEEVRKIPIHLTKGFSKPNSVNKMLFSPKKKINLIKTLNAESGMNRLNKLLRDSSIQYIECPGPGKNLIVKRYNKINVTKIIFGSVQIKEILDYFSNQARIPIVQGILKAAVGDLIISAVSSDLVGSKFIITRNTPYSLIDNSRPNRFKNNSIGKSNLSRYR